MGLFLAGCSFHSPLVAESDETMDNWVLARRYQAEYRYELARQHFALALAAARTPTVVERLKQELAAVDLQIKTLRCSVLPSYSYWASSPPARDCLTQSCRKKAPPSASCQKRPTISADSLTSSSCAFSSLRK